MPPTPLTSPSQNRIIRFVRFATDICRPSVIVSSQREKRKYANLVKAQVNVLAIQFVIGYSNLTNYNAPCQSVGGMRGIKGYRFKASLHPFNFLGIELSPWFVGLTSQLRLLGIHPQFYGSMHQNLFIFTDRFLNVTRPTKVHPL